MTSKSTYPRYGNPTSRSEHPSPPLFESLVGKLGLLLDADSVTHQEEGQRGDPLTLKESRGIVNEPQDGTGEMGV